MAKRLRKTSDGLFVLTSVDPSPTALSHSKPRETALCVLTQDDVDAIVADHAAGPEAIPTETSDDTPAKPGSGLNATPETKTE